MLTKWNLNNKEKIIGMLWKTVWQFLKKLNMDLWYDSLIPKGNETLPAQKDLYMDDRQKVETIQMSISG